MDILELKEEDFTINGTPYRIRQLPFRKAMALKVKILKILGGAANVFNVFGTNGELMDQDINFGEAIKGVIDKLDPEETPDLILKTIMDCVVSINHDVNLPKDGSMLEIYFAGRYEEVYRAFIQCLHFNFGDVLEPIKKKFLSFANTTMMPSNQTLEKSELTPA